MPSIQEAHFDIEVSPATAKPAILPLVFPTPAILPPVTPPNPPAFTVLSTTAPNSPECLHVLTLTRPKFRSPPCRSGAEKEEASPFIEFVSAPYLETSSHTQNHQANDIDLTGDETRSAGLLNLLYRPSLSVFPGAGCGRRPLPDLRSLRSSPLSATHLLSPSSPPLLSSSIPCPTLGCANKADPGGGMCQTCRRRRDEGSEA